MGIVVIVALVIAAGWWVDIRVHPFRRCPKCNGKRRNPGSGSSHWGYCSRCGGRGRGAPLGRAGDGWPKARVIEGAPRADDAKLAGIHRVLIHGHILLRGIFDAMTTQTEKAARFLELHRPGNPLLLPNPWDQGSAKLLASLGFQALATTSSGFAVTLGRSDGSVSRDEALAHAAAIVSATDLPVSADLENGFADDPDGVAHTVSLAVETGLAGLLGGGLQRP